MLLATKDQRAGLCSNSLVLYDSVVTDIQNSTDSLKWDLSKRLNQRCVREQLTGRSVDR